MIFESRKSCCGLFIELKRDRNEVYRKDGELRSNSHIRGQAMMLLKLTEKGYMAVFGLGFDDTIQKIDFYLS
jgi:hypothetical protein